MFHLEVTNGLLGTGVPQAILPGGTGNAMAHDLGVSLDLREATELIVNSDKRRAIDLAKIGDQVFMLRAFAGLSADDASITSFPEINQKLSSKSLGSKQGKRSSP